MSSHASTSRATSAAPSFGAPSSRFSSTAPDSGSDSDDEEAWDEVEIPTTASAAAAAAAGEEGISIVIAPKGKGKKKRKPDGSTTRERMIRQERHKVHVISLLATGLIRNRWLNDPLLKARILSLVPMRLQNSFTSISKATMPNERDRSRAFDQALKDLLSWWWQSFELEGGRGIVRRIVGEVEEEIRENEVRKGNRKVDFADPSRDGGEFVRSEKSLMRRAQAKRGSRDMSAQLFTALCRSLDIPARLIFSVQGVDWKAQGASGKKAAASEVEDSDAGKRGKAKARGRVGKPAAKASAKGKGKASTASSAAPSETDDGNSSWEDPRGNLGYTVPKANLRRSKPSKSYNRSPSPTAADMSKPPVFWCEVWTRANRQWIAVDPVRKKMRCRAIMEPGRKDPENQMLYVVAYEEDGSARDVTPRYAKNYNTYTVKARVPSKRGTDWFANLLLPFKRKFELNRDREEDEELWSRRANEPMPNSLQGFKDHPNYVLEQHLKATETLLPNAKKLGTFRGADAVYARSSVVTVKSQEQYWKVGRVIKDGAEPMKEVKRRTNTINRKRAEEMLKFDGGEVDLQPLYAEFQTEVYLPPPVIDGKIPKNDFGNIDLYVPSMLPFGAVHIPNRGAAKCAKTLGIDYADAVRRALPTIAGVVVAVENEDVLMEAIMTLEEVADEKEFAKRQDRVLKLWKTLITGLRIRQRIQASYNKPSKEVEMKEQESQFDKAKSRKRPAPDDEVEEEKPPTPKPIIKIKPYTVLPAVNLVSS
ncbi:hypothetical protein MNV49_003464 [Pseudohyphozyma bogoriensis]|nr:hypothetical protein MNV49_003464 [Pseudohyphozyma bogoriensis]